MNATGVATRVYGVRVTRAQRPMVDAYLDAIEALDAERAAVMATVADRLEDIRRRRLELEERFRFDAVSVA